MPRPNCTKDGYVGVDLYSSKHHLTNAQSSLRWLRSGSSFLIAYTKWGAGLSLSLFLYFFLSCDQMACNQSASRQFGKKCPNAPTAAEVLLVPSLQSMSPKMDASLFITALLHHPCGANFSKALTAIGESRARVSA